MVLPTMIGKQLRATMKALPADGLPMVNVRKQVHVTQANRGNSGGQERCVITLACTCSACADAAQKASACGGGGYA
jgi:hypothetical protein